MVRSVANFSKLGLPSKPYGSHLPLEIIGTALSLSLPALSLSHGLAHGRKPVLGKIPEARSQELPSTAIVCLRDHLWGP